jgi:hypothetical protein
MSSQSSQIVSQSGHGESPPVTSVSSAAMQSPDGAALQLDEVLWKEAYNSLDKELKLRYETILKAELNIPNDWPLQDQANCLVNARKKRVLSRQWTYKWNGKQRKVRDTIDGILNTVEKFAGLISVGMNFAPVFASVPWTAVCALLPVSLSNIRAVDLLYSMMIRSRQSCTTFGI